MGQIDLTEKQLISFKDVFADIVNVLLFNGKRLIDENDLEDIDTPSFYEFENETRVQFRDVAKAWMKNHVRIAILGVENQTVPHRDMALRCIGYDGAAYRDQIKPGNEGDDRYPVVTLVLYFGMKPWNEPTTLFERLKIPQELKPFVNDYKINLIEMRKITKEQVDLFQSDFKAVAEHYYQKCNNEEYNPSFETLRHVSEILNLLSEFTSKTEFEKVINHVQQGGDTMGIHFKEYLDKVMLESNLEAEARGRKEGRLNMLNMLNDLLKSGAITLDYFNQAKKMYNLG